jgi:hypothetical protein
MIEQILFSEESTNIGLALQLMSSMDDEGLMEVFSRCYSYWKNELSFRKFKAARSVNHFKLRGTVWIDSEGTTHANLDIVFPRDGDWIYIHNGDDGSIKICFTSLSLEYGIYNDKFFSLDNYKGISDFFRSFIKNADGNSENS